MQSWGGAMFTDAIALESYVSGVSSTPLLGMTIGDCFDKTVNRHPNGLALVAGNQNIRWRWHELAGAVDSFACGLATLGLAVGDRIAICSPNNVEWVITQFATAKLGLILVNINPGYRPKELEYALKKVGCAVLITASRFKSSDYISMLSEIAPELPSAEPGPLTLPSLPDLRHIIQIGTPVFSSLISFDELLVAGRGKVLPSVQIDFDQPINIQFTSGTTGSPKGATLTHHNVLNNGYFVGLGMGLGPEDRLCIPVPFYHCFGMVLSNLACVAHGATMVLSGESFDPLQVLQTVEAERCTALHGVPTMFISLLEHPEFGRFDLSSLRTGVMAGSPCPVEIMRRVIDIMGIKEITIAYGMTETSPISFQTHREDSLERRVSSVGRILPHLEVKIVDETGAIVSRGQQGELCTRGYSVMQGYWEDSEKTAEAVDTGGWMHTGDLATIDAEGYCNITGRIKDMVIRGGENIYPREIEEYLYKHPSVQDVQVFGVPDERFGEEVCAWIKLKEQHTCDEDSVRNFCKGVIAHYKIPRYIRFVDSFPLTASGKIQKFQMREVMMRDLGVVEAKTA